MRSTHHSPPSIDVESVRIGMDIRIEGGWLSHPFPRSRFVVATPDQLQALRSFGARSVRWFPSSSAGSRAAADRADARAGATPAAPPTPATQDMAPQPAGITLTTAAAPGGAGRFGATAEAHARMVALLRTAPREAAELATDTVRHVLEDLLAGDDQCIRLLDAVQGDAESTHAVNVAVVSLLMGRVLGLGESELVDLGVGALLHDVGKLDLAPDAHHLGCDDDAYRGHVARGVEFAEAMGLSVGACQVIAQHHEQLDGGGFPNCLRSEHLSAPARLVALVDRFDELCNPHDAAQACSPHEALGRLFQHHDGRFDTAMLSSFIKMVGVYPPGSVVQLTDNRYALVTGMHSLRPLKPTVLPYDGDATERDRAPQLDLEQSNGIGVLRSLPARALPVDVHRYLRPPSRIAYFFEPSQAMPLAA